MFNVMFKFFSKSLKNAAGSLGYAAAVVFVLGLGLTLPSAAQDEDLTWPGSSARFDPWGWRGHSPVPHNLSGNTVTVLAAPRWTMF